MRNYITALILGLATTGAASAQYGRSYEGLVESWYHRYLDRHADPIGMRNHVNELYRGTPVDFVEASILGSDEYWLRNGGTPEAFMVALYRDVLGVTPARRDVDYWVHRYLNTGSRHLLALRFLQDTRFADVHRAPVGAPHEPLYVPAAPVFVPRTAPTPGYLPRLTPEPVSVPSFRRPGASIDPRLGR